MTFLNGLVQKSYKYENGSAQQFKQTISVPRHHLLEHLNMHDKMRWSPSWVKDLGREAIARIPLEKSSGLDMIQTRRCMNLLDGKVHVNRRK